jgi:heme exporter protein D
MLLALAMAFLAFAILTIRYVVRKRDVLHGRFIERGEDEDSGEGT